LQKRQKQPIALCAGREQGACHPGVQLARRMVYRTKTGRAGEKKPDAGDRFGREMVRHGVLLERRKADSGDPEESAGQPGENMYAKR